MADNVKVTVRVDKRALDQQLLGRDGAVGRVIAGFAGLVTTEIKSEMRERTGGFNWKTTSSIKQGPRGTYSVTTIKHTKSNYPIVAKRAPKLVFFWEREQKIFAGPRVTHPGSLPPEKLILSGIERASRRVTFTAAAPRIT
jgi:hypothetical protein